MNEYSIVKREDGSLRADCFRMIAFLKLLGKFEGSESADIVLIKRLQEDGMVIELSFASIAAARQIIRMLHEYLF